MRGLSHDRHLASAHSVCHHAGRGNGARDGRSGERAMTPRTASLAVGTAMLVGLGVLVYLWAAILLTVMPV